jgi:hypothetical protein
MPALKLRKRTPRKSATKSRKIKPKTSKRLKVKAKAVKRSRVRAARKPKPPKPHPDETTVVLGPHHVERQPVAAGIHVHPEPALHIFVPAATTHRVSVRHH